MFKKIQLQLTANCIAAIRCLQYYATLIENDQPQRTQISDIFTIANILFIQNSYQVAYMYC